MKIDPKNISGTELYHYLTGAVSPRPIAFASTINKKGEVNLSPFSYFNCFSANPPILVFSPARRSRDNSTKHTLQNVLEVPEVVINIVTFDMVEQMSLTSAEYADGVNEFEKSGLTAEASEKISPPKVKESPIAFECKVNEVIPLGENGGAGNLVIAEVVFIHINRNILDNKSKIDPHKLDAVARMGGNWYCRASGDAIFEIPKPLQNVGIGVDQIPKSIRESHVFSGNDLGRLATIEKLPTKKEIELFSRKTPIEEIIGNNPKNTENVQNLIHEEAKSLLKKNKVEEAWLVLLMEY